MERVAVRRLRSVSSGPSGRPPSIELPPFHQSCTRADASDQRSHESRPRSLAPPLRRPIRSFGVTVVRYSPSTYIKMGPTPSSVLGRRGVVDRDRRRRPRGGPPSDPASRSRRATSDRRCRQFSPVGSPLRRRYGPISTVPAVVPTRTRAPVHALRHETSQRAGSADGSEDSLLAAESRYRTTVVDSCYIRTAVTGRGGYTLPERVETRHEETMVGTNHGDAGAVVPIVARYETIRPVDAAPRGPRHVTAADTLSGAESRRLCP